MTICKWLFCVLSVGLSGSAILAQSTVNVSCKGLPYPNDDTEAIRTAARTATSNGTKQGGVVVLPTGTCSLSDTVGVWGVKLVGQGRLSTTVNMYGIGGNTKYAFDGEVNPSWDGSPQPPPTIQNGQPGGTSFTGFTVNCAPNNNATGFSGVRAYYAQMSHSDVLVENCYNGFTFDMPYMASFHNLEALSNANDGFEFNDSASELMTSLDIQNCWANSNGGYGFFIGAGNYIAISNSAAQQDAKDDWRFQGDQNGQVDANYLTLSGIASESAKAHPFYFRRYRNVVMLAPATISPQNAYNYIEFDDSTGTIIGLQPYSNPPGGNYTVDQENLSTGQVGSITIINSNNLTTNPNNQSAFNFINSGNNGAQNVTTYPHH